jgi:antitoxin PrlF
MEDIHSTIAEGGRIVIPSAYRRALGLKVGDEVILRMADGEVHILTRGQAIKKAQALVRKHVPGQKSLVRELIRERRGAAANE